MTGRAFRRWSCSVVWVVLLLTACREQPSEPPAPAEKIAERPPSDQVIKVPEGLQARLRTERVKRRPVPEVVAAPGEVAADLSRVAKVTSRIDGQVERLYVRLGERVTRGQPLVAIGSLRLDELVEEYLVSKAQADVAENSFRRTERLFAESIVPERRLVEERGRYLETKARYQHVREKLLNMGMTVEELRELEVGTHAESHRYILKAPLAGTVVSQNVVLGQGISPGDDLLEVVDTSQVWVFANLPIEQARNFKAGDAGMIVPKNTDPIAARLTYLAPVAEETTRTVRVRFDVANPSGLLKPNEFVEVRLTMEGSPTLTAPASAVTMVDRVRGVFVRRDDTYVFTPIEVGREGGEWVEIVQGLQAGDVVVTDGLFDLKTRLLQEHIGSGD